MCEVEYDIDELRSENETLKSAYINLLNDYNNLKRRYNDAEDEGFRKGSEESFEIVSNIMKTVKYGVVEKPVRIIYSAIKSTLKGLGYTIVDEEWLLENTAMRFDDRYCTAIGATHSTNDVHNRYKIISQVCEDGFIDKNGNVLKYAKVIVNL